jgi:hypothetical protein
MLEHAGRTALATIAVPAGATSSPSGMAALADAPGWFLDRLRTATATLTGQLTGAGTRIDADPAAPSIEPAPTLTDCGSYDGIRARP